MKNKRLLIISIWIMILAAGCGKDNSTPIIENGNSASGNSTINITGGNDEEPAGEVSVDDILGEGVTDNLGSGAEDMLSDNTEDMPSDNVEDIVSENTADPGASADILVGISSSQTSSIYIANMSGKDITSLTLIFSEGETRGGEILNGEILKDGDLFVYTAADMNALREATGLKLSVTALAKDDTVMSFPEVRVINPAGCTVVLSHGKSTSENQAGYEVYID